MIEGEGVNYNLGQDVKPEAATQTFAITLDGAVGFNLNPAGEASRTGVAAERDRHTEWFPHPITALRSAIGAGTTVSNVRTVSTDVRQADFKSGETEWTMTIDAAGLPLSISSRADHPNLGDVVLTTTFADYQDTNGVKLTARMTGKVDAFTTWEIRATPTPC